MTSTLPVWAGVECTVNRVGDAYLNQCEKNGHQERLQDLELFAELGIQKVRYPFLWELMAPNNLNEINWEWADERLNEMKRLNLSPIAGFLHHGSGPKYTDLLDPEFPEKLEAYARAFATRYPWITDYTPVNEPLTTARFSGLYGVWYPHHKSDESFLRALYNEVKGTVLAMKAIREINPNAQLIQTEDIGRAQGTGPLLYQINFENERRWLSYDMLCGRVDEIHPLYHYLVKHGLKPHELEWLVLNPCPPNVLGVNHYLLSNRYLDHRLEHYPASFHGGNGRDQYADVGAVDTTAADLPTPESIFREVWERYQIPIAVTEVHLNGPREAQIQWIHEVASGLEAIRAEGAQVRALTVWSLLGSFDWNTLCTVFDNYYESGAFDIRAPKPRPTAITKVIKSLATGKEFHHPLFDLPGWWRMGDRKLFGPIKPQRAKRPAGQGKHHLLIVGANGTLGRAFARICELRNIPYVALTRKQMDITNINSVRTAIEAVKPWAVINTAGYVRVDEAEKDRENCFLANVTGPANMAQVCSEKNISFLHFSSDLVFDGALNDPYKESHTVAPVNVYGLSKAESEKKVMELHPEKSLIVRTSSFFGPWDEYNFVYLALRSLSQGSKFHAASDVTFSPTYVPDLVNACLDLLIDELSSIVHLSNQGHLTWAELALKAAHLSSKKKTSFISDRWSHDHLVPMPLEQLKFAAPRPAFSALGSERLSILPSYEDALDRYFHELEIPTNHKIETFQETQI